MTMMTEAEYDAIFGSGWHVGGDEIKKRLTYQTGADDPSNASNEIVPRYIGDRYFRTGALTWWTSTGTAAGNWKQDSA